MLKTMFARNPVEKTVTGITAGALPVLAELSETLAYRVLTFKPTHPTDIKYQQIIFKEVNAAKIPNYLRKNFFSTYGFANFIAPNNKPIESLSGLIKILALHAEDIHAFKKICTKIKPEINTKMVNLIKNFTLITTLNSRQYTRYIDETLASLGYIFFSLKYRENILFFCQLFKEDLKDLIKNELRNQIVGTDIKYCFVSKLLLEAFPEELDSYFEYADRRQSNVILNLIDEMEDPALKTQIHAQLIKIFIEKFKGNDDSDKEEALRYFASLSFKKTIRALRSPHLDNKNGECSPNGVSLRKTVPSL